MISPVPSIPPTPIEPSPCEACGACPAQSGAMCPRWRAWFAQMWQRVTGRECVRREAP